MPKIYRPKCHWIIKFWVRGHVGENVVRVQVREVGQRVQCLQLEPCVQPDGKQLRDFGLALVQPVGKVEVPWNQGMNARRKERITLQTQSRDQPGYPL